MKSLSVGIGGAAKDGGGGAKAAETAKSGGATAKSGGATAKSGGATAKGDGGAAKGSGGGAKAAETAAAGPAVAAAYASAATAAEAAAAEAAAKAAAELVVRGTGEITVAYCESRVKFPIKGGRATVDVIDEEMALTFAYPNSQVHLTRVPVRGNDWRTVDWSKLEARDEEGNFSGLLAGELYYAAVIEDGKEKEKYEQQQRERAAAFAARASASEASGSSEYQLSIESCSCIEGNACATMECCLDWPGRFENARRVLEDRKVRKEQLKSQGGVK